MTIGTLSIVRCIFCHTVTNRTAGRAYCNDCNVRYFIRTEKGATNSYIYRVSFYFSVKDAKYRISLWPWENQTDLCYDGQYVMAEPIISFPQLFWIFPQTLQYWKDKFTKLMVII